MRKPIKWQCTVCGSDVISPEIKSTRVNSKMVHDLCDRCISALGGAGILLESVEWVGEGKNFKQVFKTIPSQLGFPVESQVPIHRSENAD